MDEHGEVEVSEENVISYPRATCINDINCFIRYYFHQVLCMYMSSNSVLLSPILVLFFYCLGQLLPEVFDSKRKGTVMRGKEPGVSQTRIPLTSLPSGTLAALLSAELG